MNIEQQLLVAHSRANGMLVANYASKNPKHIDLLIQLAKQEVVYQQRASQALAYAVEHLKFNLSTKQLNSIVALLKDENLHDAVHRGVLKVLDLQKSFPEESESFLFDYCITQILNPQRAIAIRAFSVPIAYKVVLKYPDLKNELIQILESLSPMEGPGINFRKKHYLALLKK